MMVHVLPHRDFVQVKYEMLQVKYVDLGNGSDPIVLSATNMSTHIQRIDNSVWNEPVIGTAEGGPYDLLSSQCALPLVGGPELYGMMFSGTECDVFRLKPGVGQYIAIPATLTSGDFLLAYFYLRSIHLHFFQTSPNVFLCSLWLPPVPVWARRIK